MRLFSPRSGGLVGNGRGTIKNSYYLGVSDAAPTGGTANPCFSFTGLVGREDGPLRIDSSFAAGIRYVFPGVADRAVGIIESFNAATGVFNTYYDHESLKPNVAVPMGTPKTTAKMKNQTTLVDWDSAVWKFSPNEYPKLSWEN